MAGDHCKRKDEQAGDHSKLDHPFILYRIYVRTYKKNSQYKMGKCQPVVPITDKRILHIRIMNTPVYFIDPLAEGRTRLKKPGSKIQFCFYRYCRNPAKGQHYQEEEQQSLYV